MSKQLRNYQIYIAPKIRGYINDNGEAIVFDEISNTQLNPTNVDDKITIYERQVKEWFLNRAKTLLRGKNNGFIVLMIAISYIEGVEEYMRGESSKNHSKEFFRAGMRRIFNLTVEDAVLNDFYDQVRCGLFHSGMTLHKVIINSTFEEVIDFSEPDSIKISPKKFLKMIMKDYDKYLHTLRNTNNLTDRNKFSSRFTNI